MDKKKRRSNVGKGELLSRESVITLALRTSTSIGCFLLFITLRIPQEVSMGFEE